MFAHNKRLQYTVRVSETNPALANLMLEQFGGPQGELAAAMRYFTQAVAEDDPGRKDMLYDIATEELSHLEVIGHIVCMLNKGLKGAMAEGMTEEGELFKKLNAGGDSHVTGLLYGAAYLSLGRIWPVMIAHAAFDVAAVFIIYWDLERSVAGALLGTT